MVKRHTEEFKIEAVKQLTDRGHKILDVAKRLGGTYKSLYDWVKRYKKSLEERLAEDEQSEEIRNLKAELRRVTEQRGILKEVAVYLAGESKYTFIASRPKRYPVATMCNILNVHRSGFIVGSISRLVSAQ